MIIWTICLNCRSINHQHLVYLAIVCISYLSKNDFFWWRAVQNCVLSFHFGHLCLQCVFRPHVQHLRLFHAYLEMLRAWSSATEHFWLPCFLKSYIQQIARCGVLVALARRLLLVERSRSKCLLCTVARVGRKQTGFVVTSRSRPSCVSNLIQIFEPFGA